MEKLIELLNEYEKKEKNSEYYEWEKSAFGPFHLFVRDIYDEHHIYSETADTYAISKKFGFIKWLVENEKISYNKVPEHRYISDYSFETIHEGMTDNILMWLAIQDEPIEFLVSILK